MSGNGNDFQNNDGPVNEAALRESDQIATELETPNDDRSSASGDMSGIIKVYDPGSKSEISMSGDIITAIGGSCELRASLHDVIIASSGGATYYSRSHQTSPLILSEIHRIETINGEASRKAPVDMTTLAEMYRQHYQRIKAGGFGVGRNEHSRMQRDLMSIVAKAAARNASDIHIVVNKDHAVVRFRVDGIIEHINEMQPQYAFELLSAAFVLADTSDTAYQKRAYQGARISSLTSELPTGVQSLRLQFNPLANEGRYLVIRILYEGSGIEVGLNDLGYSEGQIRQISIMTARPVGINILSGPTGSGKTTTMKSILESVIRRRNGEVNTITIEDPPEYIIADAQQLPVTNAKTQEQRSEAFTQAISAGLRSDPDIIMIGEIRDLASAELAVEGALSGHPIYATLHANSAMDILVRLRDMGIDDFKIFDPTMFCALAGQRLVRRLCPKCRMPLNHSEKAEHFDKLLIDRIRGMIGITPDKLTGPRTLYAAGSGCENCSNGYRGRVAVSEIILPDERFMAIMRDGHRYEARKYWFEEMQGLDMLGYAWIGILDGKFSPVDVENSVGLLQPADVHRHALESWFGRHGGNSVESG
ncbi:MAG: ATPase, T2SS/T4P/T4SS family [Roseovarius sp.]|nr:ATPase, T2SS/T4P/T4SS family [Roseovarius sp.]